MQRARVPHVVVGEQARRTAHDLAEERVRACELLDERASFRIGRWLGRDDGRHARFLRLGKPDPEVQIEWRRDLVGEELSRGATVDAADDLADDPAKRPHVVAVRGTRFPVRLLRGDGVDDRVPGQYFVESEVTFDMREPPQRWPKSA